MSRAYRTCKGDWNPIVAEFCSFPCCCHKLRGIASLPAFLLVFTCSTLTAVTYQATSHFRERHEARFPVRSRIESGRGFDESMMNRCWRFPRFEGFCKTIASGNPTSVHYVTASTCFSFAPTMKSQIFSTFGGINLDSSQIYLPPISLLVVRGTSFPVPSSPRHLFPGRIQKRHASLQLWQKYELSPKA